jgi:hypothetical protein
MRHDHRVAWRAALVAVAALLLASPCFGQSPSPFQTIPGPAPAPVVKPRPHIAPQPDTGPAVSAPTVAPEPQVSAAEALKRGNAANDRHDYAEAMRWWRKGADLGDDNAMFQLGLSYQFGTRGVPADYAQAILWYRRAAAIDPAGGVMYHSIGSMYEWGGHGISQDIAQARYYYQLSVQAGDADAKDWLAKH